MRLPCLLCLFRVCSVSSVRRVLTFAVFALYILNFFYMAIIIMAAQLSYDVIYFDQSD